MCSDSTWTKLFLLSSVSFYTTYIFVSGEGFWEVEGWEGKIGQGNTWREKRGRQAILLGIMPLSIIRLKKRGPNTCYCKFGCYCKIVIAKLAKATLEERREVDKLFWDIMPLSKIRLRKKGDNTYVLLPILLDLRDTAAGPTSKALQTSHLWMRLHPHLCLKIRLRGLRGNCSKILSWKALMRLETFQARSVFWWW